MERALEDNIVEFLSKLLEVDEVATTSLCNLSIRVGAGLAKSEVSELAGLVVGGTEKSPTIAIIGILNGVLAYSCRKNRVFVKVDSQTNKVIGFGHREV